MFSFSVGFFLRKPCFSAKKVSFSQFLTTKNEKTEKNRGDPIRGGDPERLRNRKTIFGFHPIRIGLTLRNCSVLYVRSKIQGSLGDLGPNVSAMYNRLLTLNSELRFGRLDCKVSTKCCGQ